MEMPETSDGHPDACKTNKENFHPAAQHSINLPTNSASNETLKSESNTMVAAHDQPNKLFRAWRHEAKPVVLPRKLRVLEEIILEMGHTTIECYCLGRELAVHEAIASHFSSLLHALNTKAAKSSRSSVVEEQVLSLRSALEADFRRVYPTAVTEFREKVYKAVDFLPPDENAEPTGEETVKTRKRVDQTAFTNQLRSATELAKRVFAQRAANAGSRLLIAQLDAQMKSYTDFNEYLGRESTSLGTVTDAERRLADLDVAAQNMDKLRNIKDNILSQRQA